MIGTYRPWCPSLKNLWGEIGGEREESGTRLFLAPIMDTFCQFTSCLEEVFSETGLPALGITGSLIAPVPYPYRTGDEDLGPTSRTSYHALGSPFTMFSGVWVCWMVASQPPIGDSFTSL
jgi:hypothetical protein